jgi:hypothetical protein
MPIVCRLGSICHESDPVPKKHDAPRYLFQKHVRSNNMILDWFNAEEAVLFAQEIDREIYLLFHPEHQKGKAIPAKAYQKIR